jgi:hypothetical protein
MNEGHRVPENPGRVRVPEDDAGPIEAEVVEAERLRGALLLADDLQVLHPSAGVGAGGRHEGADARAALLLQPIHVDDDLGHLRARERARLPTCDDDHVRALSALDEEADNPSADVARRAQHDRSVVVHGAKT